MRPPLVGISELPSTLMYFFVERFETVLTYVDGRPISAFFIAWTIELSENRFGGLVSSVTISGFSSDFEMFHSPSSSNAYFGGLVLTSPWYFAYTASHPA